MESPHFGGGFFVKNFYFTFFGTLPIHLVDLQLFLFIVNWACPMGCAFWLQTLLYLVIIVR